MNRIQKRIDEALRDVETIHSFVHPLGDPDHRQNLYNARARREDMVRLTVLQMALAIEDMLASNFWRIFAGHNPHSKKRSSKKRGPARELDELLTTGRLGLDAKIKLARVVGLISKKQHRQLEILQGLRNRCAHHWILDVIHKRGRKARRGRRLLEYEGRDLFDLEVLRDFMSVYSGVYLRLFEKYLD